MSNQIIVPSLGESITEATVSKWLKQVNEEVDSDEPLVELETDKVNVEVPSPLSGVLSSIKVKEGDTVKVGALLGEVTEGKEKPKNMGAWFSVRDYIQWTLDTINANNKTISYIGRSPDASPATGYAKRHHSQQEEIINKVFK